MRVYSHSYWLVIFFLQPIAAECWRERGGKLSRILEKNTIFNEHPVQNNNKTKKRVNIDKVKITNADNVCYISDGKVRKGKGQL